MWEKQHDHSDQRMYPPPSSLGGRTPNGSPDNSSTTHTQNLIFGRGIIGRGGGRGRGRGRSTVTRSDGYLHSHAIINLTSPREEVKLTSLSDTSKWSSKSTKFTDSTPAPQPLHTGETDDNTLTQRRHSEMDKTPPTESIRKLTGRISSIPWEALSLTDFHTPNSSDGISVLLTMVVNKAFHLRRELGHTQLARILDTGNGRGIYVLLGFGTGDATTPHPRTVALPHGYAVFD